MEKTPLMLLIEKMNSICGESNEYDTMYCEAINRCKRLATELLETEKKVICEAYDYGSETLKSSEQYYNDKFNVVNK